MQNHQGKEGKQTKGLIQKLLEPGKKRSSNSLSKTLKFEYWIGKPELANLFFGIFKKAQSLVASKFLLSLPTLLTGLPISAEDCVYSVERLKVEGMNLKILRWVLLHRAFRSTGTLTRPLIDPNQFLNQFLMSSRQLEKWGPPLTWEIMK